MNIFGKPKAGKSLAALQLASCISDATRGDYLGFPIHKHGPCAYLQLDTPRSIWALDVENGTLDLGLCFDDVHFADKEMAPRPFYAHEEGGKWLRTVLAQLRPVAVFVDTLRKTHDGDENDSGVMKQVYEALQLACSESAIVIISHARKGSNDFEELMSENRGSNYLAGEMDVVVKVTKKQFHYEGRTIDERKLTLQRTPHGFWRLEESEYKQKAQALLNANKHLSTHALSLQLASESGLHVEAARSLLRRLKGT